MKEFGLFINNQWLRTEASFESINPATEQAVASFSVAGEVEVNLAVQAARAAFDGGAWSGMQAMERGRILRKAAELISAHAREFAVAETLDTGKPIHESTNLDVPMAIGSLEYYASLTADIVGKCIPVGDFALDYTVLEPVGVVACIIPWNFPLALACRKLGPALAAGNTVIVKPASVTPLTTMMLGEVFQEAGMPPGVVNIITGSGGTAGKFLLNHTGLDKISFTGSTDIGREVIAASAKSIRDCSLELGGKSPVVVLADAPLNETADGILFGAFLNQGECCCAATRVLVDPRLHAPLVKLLVEKAARIKLGDGMDEMTRMGPVVSEEHQRAVLRYIEEGIREAGAPVLGGAVLPELAKGYFVQPTIFDNVATTCKIYREEIFGPVLTVTPIDGVERMIEAANDTPYGLAASIWTANAAVGQRLATRIKAGTVWVNTHNFVFNQAPYGGVKQSGIGRELGREGLDAYTEVKNVITWLGEEGFKWY